jgi:hypothetical protein
VSELLHDPRGSTELSAHLLESSQLYSAGAFRARVTEALYGLGVF